MPNVAVIKTGLKKARERKGLTQTQAGELLGYSLEGYSKIERGSRKMSADFIRRAAEAFGCNPEDIIDSISEAESLGLDAIDPEKLASFVAAAKERIASLSEIEAKNLVLALISAARRP